MSMLGQNIKNIGGKEAAATCIRKSVLAGILSTAEEKDELACRKYVSHVAIPNSTERSVY
jgi:hypothetical protein